MEHIKASRSPALTNALNLFKMELGVTHDKRDSLYLHILEAGRKEMGRWGILLNLEDTDDLILLVDYTLWAYEKKEHIMPFHIRQRILNRQIRERASRVQAQRE